METVSFWSKFFYFIREFVRSVEVVAVFFHVGANAQNVLWEQNHFKLTHLTCAVCVFEGITGALTHLIEMKLHPMMPLAVFIDIRSLTGSATLLALLIKFALHVMELTKQGETGKVIGLACCQGASCLWLWQCFLYPAEPHSQMWN